MENETETNKIKEMIKNKHLSRGGWHGDGKSTYRIFRGEDTAVTDISDAFDM